MNDLNPPLNKALESLHKRVVAALPSITVEKHPYDIGYWACNAGFNMPMEIKDPEFTKGWKQNIADRHDTT